MLGINVDGKADGLSGEAPGEATILRSATPM
jgi:hypothetical protein